MNTLRLLPKFTFTYHQTLSSLKFGGPDQVRNNTLVVCGLWTIASTVGPYPYTMYKISIT